MGFGQWMLLVVLSVFWGASFFFVEVAVKTVTPLTLVACRVGIAAVILLVYAVMTRRPVPRNPGIWAGFFILGALNNALPFSLIAWGQSHIDSSLASILNATTPVFSVVLAHFLTTDERLTKNKMAGVILGWVGVTVLIGIEALGGLGVQTAGQAAVLCAALLYALAAIFGRRYKDLDPVVVAAGMLCASTILITPAAFMIETPFEIAFSSIPWKAVLALAVISTALAYIIYFKILSTAGVTNIVLVTFLIPVSAILLGILALGETPGWNAFAGMGLIFTGLLFIDGRLVPSGKK